VGINYILHLPFDFSDLFICFCLALYIEIFSSFDECMKVIQKEKSDEKNSDAENLIYSNVLSLLTLNKA